MAKKKQKEEILDFQAPIIKVEIINSPTFERGYEPYINNKNKFNEIKNNIHNLKVNEFLLISKENTGLNLHELRKRITNISLCHKRKFTEKQFSIKETSKIKLKIHRIK